MSQNGISLNVVMPIPSATLSRGHPWPVAARAYIYEGVETARKLGALIGRHWNTVAIIRRADKWREFREQAITRQTAERHGLGLPFILAAGSLDGQISIESDERAERAGSIRDELHAVMDCMRATNDKASARYARLVSSVAALQQQLDSLLGLDVAKKVGTASAIARQRAALRRPSSKMPADRRAMLHAEPVEAPEPDMMTLALPE